MKKITFLAVAFLSVTTGFSQTNQTAVNAKSKTTFEASAEKKDQSVKASTNGSASFKSDLNANQTDANTETTAKSKTTVKAGKSKKNAPNQNNEENTTPVNHGQTVAAVAQESQTKAMVEGDKIENHGQAVATVAQNNLTKAQVAGEQVMENSQNTAVGLAQSTEAKIKAEGKRAEHNGRAGVNFTQQTEASAATNAKIAKEESNQVAIQVKQRTQAELNGQLENTATHGEAVAQVGQNVTATGQTKGQEVKEVATSKRTEKPAKVEAEENVQAATQVKSIVRRGGASRAAGAARAAGRVNASGTGAAANVNGVVNSAVRSAKPNNNGGSARPVQVGGAVKIGTNVKLGN